MMLRPVLATLGLLTLPALALAQSVPERDGLCEVAIDDGADGTINASIHYAYDAVGGLLEERYDGDGDGVAEVVAQYQRERGRVVAVEGIWGASGAVYRRTLLTYDANDRIAALGFDVNGDGRVERSESYDYDDDDRLLRTRFDDEQDGRFDRIAEFSYDDLGRLIRETIDTDLDGIPNYEVRTTWGGAVRVREAIDTDGDGRDNMITVCLHNAAEGTLFCEQDVDGDGSFDVILETWHDRSQRPELVAIHPSEAPSVQMHVAIEYNAMERHPLADAFSGLVGRHLIDGIPNELRRFERDPIGRLVLEEIDSNRDGFVDRRIHYLYTCDVAPTARSVAPTNNDDAPADGSAVPGSPTTP